MPNTISPAVVVLVFALGLNIAEARGENIAPKCTSLRTADFSMIPDAPTQILSSRIVEPNNGGITYCEVRGYVSPATNFELRLPVENWNEKFWMVGNGGSGGQIPAAACENRVRRGYACVATDMGHTSTSGDNKWAYNNLQAIVDWGFRATHVAAVAGKAITGWFYGKAPVRSYFTGCSTGGRQGLVEAQRFPWDFDGIVAGAPGLSPSGVSFKNTWMFLSNRDSEGKQILRPDDMKLVHDAVVSHCDMDDNLRDGIIGDPRKCKFDATSLACVVGQQSGCLNAAQIGVLRKFYDGPGEATGHSMVFAGVPLGSELNWINFVVFGTDQGGSGAGDFWRYLGFYPAPGPAWQMKDFDFQRDDKRLDMVESLYSATNPDLRRFKEAGGKLIMWSGWEDPAA